MVSQDHQDHVESQVCKVHRDKEVKLVHLVPREHLEPVEIEEKEDNRVQMVNRVRQDLPDNAENLDRGGFFVAIKTVQL